VALTSAETNSFLANYPAEKLPVGTWTTTGGQKQWCSTWVVPGSMPAGTVFLLR